MKRHAELPLAPERSRPAIERALTPVEGISYLRRPVEKFELSDRYRYARHEAAPRTPYYHPGCDQILEHIRKSTTTLAEKLRASGPLNSQLRDLVEGLSRLAHINFGEPLRVGVLGQAASGKSTFINVLLEQSGLVATGDNGSSCTQVVTEFIDNPLRDGMFHAEVQFKNASSIIKQLRAIFDGYHRSIESRDGDTDGADELDGLEHSPSSDEDAKGDQEVTAEEILPQLFADVPGMQDPDSLESTVSSLTSEQIRPFLNDLLERCESLVAKACTDNRSRVFRLKAANLMDLSSKLKPYTASQSCCGTIALWPLVAKVTVRMDSILLRQGFSIADVPGWNDTNIMRKEGALEYIQSCNMILMLSRCERITTDDDTKKSLKNHTRHATSPLLLLPTRCEEADSTLPKNRLSPEDHAEIAQMEAQFEQAIDARRKHQISEHQNPEQLKAALELERHLGSSLTRLRSLTRSKWIVEHFQHLQQKASSSARNGYPADLRTIPISSKTQQTYNDGDGGMNVMCLGPTETGIADVRRALCCEATKTRFSQIREHLEDEIPVPMMKIKMALTKIPDGRIAEVLRTMEKDLDARSESSPQHPSEIRVAFEKRVLSRISGFYGRHDRTWSSAWISNIAIWRSTYTNCRTIKAFLNKHGRHKPAQAPRIINMNESILTLVYNDVHNALGDFEAKFNDVISNVQGQVLRGVKRLRKDLESSAQADKTDLEAFFTTFEINQRAFPRDLKRRTQKFLKDLKMQFSTLMAETDHTPFGQAMVRVYEAALVRIVPSQLRSRGQRLTPARWDFLRDSVLDMQRSSPFPVLKASLDNAFNVLSKKLCDDIEGMINGLLAGFYNNLKINLEGDQADSMSALQQEKVKRVFDEARVAFDNDIAAAKSILQSIEKSYNTKYNED